MATDAAEVDAARTFAEKVGVVGAAFDALLALDVEVSDGVPKAVQQGWRKWCLRNHTDKGVCFACCADMCACACLRVSVNLLGCAVSVLHGYV